MLQQTRKLGTSGPGKWTFPEPALGKCRGCEAGTWRKAGGVRSLVSRSPQAKARIRGKPGQSQGKGKSKGQIAQHVRDHSQDAWHVHKVTGKAIRG